VCVVGWAGVQLLVAVLFVLQPWLSWHEHVAGNWVAVAAAMTGSIFHGVDAVLTRRLVYGGVAEAPEHTAVSTSQWQKLTYYRAVGKLVCGTGLGSASAGFGKGYTGLYRRAFNRQIFTGLSSASNRQHNFFPSALMNLTNPATSHLRAFNGHFE
jgi:hypothetical protein